MLSVMLLHKCGMSFLLNIHNSASVSTSKRDLKTFYFRHMPPVNVCALDSASSTEQTFCAYYVICVAPLSLLACTPFLITTLPHALQTPICCLLLVFTLPSPPVVLVLQPPHSGTHSHLAFTTLPLPIPFVTVLKLTASSRPSAPPNAGFPRLLGSPGFFLENSRTWKVLENHFGPGKSWKLKLEVLEKYPWKSCIFSGLNDYM